MDGTGNLYIADARNDRIRKVDGATGVITTVAGNGERGYFGDGGLATSASLANPLRVAVDGTGNLYIADTVNHRIRRVDAATGVITTVAGNGIKGFSGDGGPANFASLNSPEGVVVDVSGNLYIAVSENNRIRRVDGSTGVITTVAGNGTSVFSGDGGDATRAGLGGPDDLALDGKGNLYIAEFGNQRLHKVEGLAAPVARPGTGSFFGRTPVTTARADGLSARRSRDDAADTDGSLGLVLALIGVGGAGLVGGGWIVYTRVRRGPRPRDGRPIAAEKVAKTVEDTESQAPVLTETLREAAGLASSAAEALNAGSFADAARLTEQAIGAYSRARNLAPEAMREELGRALEQLADQQRDAERGLAVARYNAAMDSTNDLTREADTLFEDGQRSLAAADFEHSETSFHEAEERFSAAMTALTEARGFAEAAGTVDLTGVDAAAGDLREATLGCRIEVLRGRLLRAEAHLEADEVGQALDLFQQGEEQLAGIESGDLGQAQAGEIESLLGQSREGVSSCRLREASVSLQEGNRRFEAGEYVDALDSYSNVRQVLADVSTYAIRHGLSERRGEIDRLNQLVDTNTRRATQAPIRLEIGGAPELPVSLPVRPRRQVRTATPSREGRRLRSLVQEIDSYFRDDE